MLVFPQLKSGSCCQYPIRKTLTRHTFRNSFAGGEVIQAADSDVLAVKWDLTFRGIDNDERVAIEELHREVQGTSKPFLFLDPLANLFAYSADLAAPVWRQEGRVLVQVGEDTSGRRGATLTNTGATAGRLYQVVKAPGSFRYSLSVWIDSHSTERLGLVCEGAGHRVSEVKTNRGYARYWANMFPDDPSQEIKVGFELEPGAQVFVAAPQLDAQPAPAAYRPSIGSGGGYTNAHFGERPLRTIQTGVNEFSCKVEIEALARE